MDPQLATQLESIKNALLVIAVAVSILALVGLGVIGVVAQIPKYLRSRMSFADQAKLLLDQGQTEKVIAICERRIEEYPGEANAWWYLGQAAFRSGHYSRALNAMRKVEGLQPDWPSATQFIEAIETKLLEKGDRPELKVVTPPTGSAPPSKDVP